MSTKLWKLTNFIRIPWTKKHDQFEIPLRYRYSFVSVISLNTIHVEVQRALPILCSNQAPFQQIFILHYKTHGRQEPSRVNSRHQTRLGRSVKANLRTATSVCQAAVIAWGGAGAGCGGAGGGLSTVPHAFNSVNTSVKKPGSELILSMLNESRSTINRHRSQNLSLESSTRNGLSG